MDPINDPKTEVYRAPESGDSPERERQAEEAEEAPARRAEPGREEEAPAQQGEGQESGLKSG